MSTLTTPAKRAALADALIHGDVWKGAYSGRRHSALTINRLRDEGLIYYHSITDPGYSGGWRLTDAGRALALSLDDTESSASRQHYIDTGRYLPFAAREDLNPSPYAVNDVFYAKNNADSRYKVLSRRLDDRGTWWYDVKVISSGRLLTSVRADLEHYPIVQPEPEPWNWELLAPLAAQAAVLVALGRGDEVVPMYDDTVITALELLETLVEAGK